jgi:eukaryotic-like serine/threonine-protein kinase
MKIPGYDILDKDGEDRLTVMWKANQASLDRIVTLKVLRPEFASDPDQRRDFLAEGRMIAKLKHPHILQVYDVIEQEGVVALVIEPLSGASLAARIANDGPMPAKGALQMALQVAEALKHAWTASHVVHRNIKPENIYLDGGDVRVAFFGHCKTVAPMERELQEDRDTLVGTPYYMAPEQAQCRADLDTRADMYSLGAVLYHATTGKTPFDEFDPVTAAEKQISATIPHPRTLKPDLARGCCAVMEKLMSKDRNHRPANWDAVVEEMQKALAGRLLRARAEPGAVSTIEPEAPPATAVSGAVRSATSSAAAATGGGLGIPFWFRVPAWGALLAWWYQLARMMTQYWAAP